MDYVSPTSSAAGDPLATRVPWICFGYPTIMISLSSFKPLPSLASFAQAYSDLVRVAGFLSFHLSPQLSQKLQTLTLLVLFFFFEQGHSVLAGTDPVQMLVLASHEGRIGAT